jgi:hypothetical protein
MNQSVGKRANALLIILIATASILIGFGIRKDISVLFEYFTTYSKSTDSGCRNFSAHYQLYKSLEPWELFSFLQKSYGISNGIRMRESAQSEKIDFNQITEIELEKFCIKNQANEIISIFILNNNATSYFNKSIGALDYHKLKIVFNIAAGVMGFLILQFIAARVKVKSEGVFRMAILFGFAIASIPFFITPYYELATPQTQAITFPASIFLTLYLIYKIYKWIADGFAKSSIK